MVAVLALAGCGPTADDDSGSFDVGQITGEARAAAPTGKNIGTIFNSQRSRKVIEYHNGPVMPGAQDVYLIWYGDWSHNLSAQTILSDFASSVGGSPYLQINSRYANAAGQAPSGGLLFGGAVVDAYSHGHSLSDADLASVVADQIASSGLPQDPSGLYVILGAADVNATSGLCTSYCGMHSSGIALGVPFRYIFVGNAERCPCDCMPQQAHSPNGNPGADAMVNILANEMSTTVTDPALTGWYDRNGFDNADKCAWTFGTTFRTANGARANIHLGQRDFLIQRNWWPTSQGGICVMNASQAAAAIAAGEDLVP